MHSVLCVNKTGGDVLSEITYQKSYITPTFITYDEHGRVNGKDVNEAVTAQCLKQRPDLILVVGQPDTYTVCNFSWIEHLSKKGFKIGVIWYDSVDYMPQINRMSFCYHIVLDDMTIKAKNIVNVWTPFNPFVHSQHSQDIPVSFIGKIMGFERVSHVKELLNRSIPIFLAGNDRWNYIDSRGIHNEFIRRSKIGLNFPRCKNNQNKTQLKGRIFDIICGGSLLVEPENNQTKLFFTPEEEYISYKTIDEAAEKIKYYLSNERERLQIVWRAAARIKHYNMNEWWKIVMDKIPTGIITMN